MLAQNFKTAEELQLTDKGLLAMIEVLRRLESGELKWIPMGTSAPKGFNMAVGWLPEVSRSLWTEDCGTIGCIAGWANQIAYGHKDCRQSVSTRSNAAWGALVTPTQIADWGKITVDQAAKALRSFLVTGTPDWGLD